MQVVHSIQMDRVLSSYEDDDTFQVRKDRSMVWVQKACAWIMRRLGAFRIANELKMDTKFIDAERVMNRILTQYSDMLKMFNMRPDTLVMGTSDYARIMHDMPAAEYPFKFKTQYMLDGQLHGMKVIVVPWMQGVLVLPPN